MRTLVLSLDFELRWGLLDKLQSNIELYRGNLESVHENVPWMLKVFKERNISSTWAVVGALGCEDWEEFDKIRPKNKPSYLNKKFDYDNDFNRKIDPNGELYFAPNLIKEVIKTSNQELGSHTFGHIYATEENITYDELKHDLLTSKEFLSQKFNVLVESLVYPRNQVIHEKKLLDEGIIKTYRGNENVDYLSTQSQKNKKFSDRAKILLDSLNPFISHSFDKSKIINGNVLSSSMFRIYLSSYLRRMHLYKLKKNINDLKENEIYHIWYHPHNLDFKNISQKDDFLKFFDYIGDQIAKNKLCSENMGSIIKK